MHFNYLKKSNKSDWHLESFARKNEIGKKIKNLASISKYNFNTILYREVTISYKLLFFK